MRGGTRNRAIRVHSCPFAVSLFRGFLVWRCRLDRETRANSPLAANQEPSQPCTRMRFIETVFQKLKRHPKRIVFPDATEPRVLRAAARFVKLQLGAPVVLGRKDEVEKVALEEKI